MKKKEVKVKKTAKKIAVKIKTKKQSKTALTAEKEQKAKKSAQKPAKKAIKTPVKAKTTLLRKPSAKTIPVKKVSKKPAKVVDSTLREAPVPSKRVYEKRKVAGIPRKTLKKMEETLKPAGAGKTYHILPSGIGLPQEYGEDKISLMVVDPWRLFTYWEAREDTIAKIKGQLVVRIYDVTGINFDGRNANIVFDIPAHSRIGDCYIGVAPNKEFIVDLGVPLKTGEFKKIARSNKAATPAIETSKAVGDSLRRKGVLPQEMYEAERVGYL